MKYVWDKGRLASLLFALCLALLPCRLSAQAVSKTLSAPAAVSVTADTAVHPSETFIPRMTETINQHPAYYIFILTGCVVLLAFIRLMAPAYLSELLNSIVNLKVLLNSFQEGRFGFNVMNLLLDVVAVLMFSLLIQEAFYYTRPEILPWVIAFVSLAYFLKLILIQLFASIYFGKGEALVHLLLHLLFTRVMGIVLLPFIFIGLYQNRVSVPDLVSFLTGFLLLFYFLWFLRLFLKMKSVSISGIFYLFLYLCTIELSPLIIFVKDFIL